MMLNTRITHSKPVSFCFGAAGSLDFFNRLTTALTIKNMINNNANGRNIRRISMGVMIIWNYGGLGRT